MDLKKIIIKEAEAKHIEHLKKMWKNGFGDTDEYITFFFDNKYQHCKTIVALYDDIPVAVVYLMDVYAIEFEIRKNGYYAYALTVSKEYRNIGLGKLLIKEICRYAKNNNKFVILCPADEGLCAYYASLGFIENSYVIKKTRNKNKSGIFMTYNELDSKTFKQLRNKHFKNCIYWDEFSLEYVLAENLFLNGHNICVDYNADKFYILFKCNDKTAEITENNVPVELQQIFTDFICSKFNCNQCIWTIPNGQEPGQVFLYGMTFNLKKDNYYMNLLLN